MAIGKWIVVATPLLVAAPSAGHAVTEANFGMKTTGDLVALCDPGSDSPMAVAAVNFCSGFAQGAVAVQMQHDAASRGVKLFCLPSPLPSRTEALSEFIKWARASPARMGEPPADGLFRFLGERFPCPKS